MPPNAFEALTHAEYIRIENEYRREIERLMKSMEPVLRRAQTPDEFMRILNSASYWADLYLSGEQAAKRMAARLNRAQSSSWRQAAAGSVQGRKLFRALQKEMQMQIGARIRDIVQQNSSLISSIPRKLTPGMSKLALEGYRSGKRAAEIAEEMKAKLPAECRNRARLIARTETAKASTALVQSRAESLGLKFYIWRTSEDERVRDSHKAMDGVVCLWSSPPSPEAIAGEENEPAAITIPAIFSTAAVSPFRSLRWKICASRSGSAPAARTWLPSAILRRCRRLRRRRKLAYFTLTYA